MFEARSTEDLMRIAAAGGSLTMDARARSVDDLMRIAAAAGSKGSRICFRGLEHLSTEDLMQISAAGKGCVEFS